MVSICSDVGKHIARDLPLPGRPVPAECPIPMPKTLAEPSFAAAVKQIEQTAEGLITEAVTASKNERRAASQIVVEGVRLFELSDSSASEWSDLARRALSDRGIRVNDGANFQFRVVANFLFRHLTQGKDDTDLADSVISRSQITRYAQAMAWAYAKYKSGTNLDQLAGDVVKLGGVRKVADLWANAQRFREDEVAAASVERPSESSGSPDQTEVPASGLSRAENTLTIIGNAKLKQAIATPVVCLIYPDGKVLRAPLAPDTMTAMVAQWEASQ